MPTNGTISANVLYYDGNVFADNISGPTGGVGNFIGDASTVNSGILATARGGTNYTQASDVTSTLDILSKTSYLNLTYQSSTILEPVQRLYVNSVVGLTNNGVRIVIFTPSRNFTVSKLATWCGTAGTDTGGTTTRRMGLFTQDTPGGTSWTCVARTASDATLWNSTGLAERSLDTTGGFPSTYTLTAGTTYALGVVSYNTGGTYGAPSLASESSSATVYAGMYSTAPAMQYLGSATEFTGTSQTIGTVSSNAVWFRLT